MIPKIIFQISNTFPPKYVIDQIRENSVGWEYFCFNNTQMAEYMEKTPPIKDFEIAATIYKTIISQRDKDLFFRYYFLYINGGVFIDNAEMIDTNIEEIISDSVFCYVEPANTENGRNNNFLACENENNIIKHILLAIYTIDKTVLSTKPNWVDAVTFELIQTNSSKIDKINKMVETNRYDDKSEVRSVGGKLLYSFYYADSVVKQKNPPIKGKPVSIQETKIGLTFILPTNIGDMYSDGIKQNVLYLYELLKNIGYDAYILMTTNATSGCKLNETDFSNLFYYKNSKVIDVNQMFGLDLDIVINMGFFIDNTNLRILKYLGAKIVGYFCGNNYIIESEKILYNHNNEYNFYKTINSTLDKPVYDKLWSIPQMYNTNKYYWQVTHRCDCIEVPFIWSNHTIDLSKAIIGETSIKEYENRGTEKTIAILEPNLSIMKSFIPPILICENYYRENKTSIKRVYLNNIVEDKKVIQLNRVVEYLNQFDLYFDSKISVEGRYNSLFVMSNYADVVVSHTWENNLNYLYLELAWMGYPVVHNGSLCKDVGYYYEGFNYDMGKEMLKRAIVNHDANIEGYITKNRRVIDQYLPSNSELQAKYMVLINNLFDE